MANLFVQFSGEMTSWKNVMETISCPLKFTPLLRGFLPTLPSVLLISVFIFAKAFHFHQHILLLFF